MKKIFSLLIFCLIAYAGNAQDVARWKIGDLENYIKNSDKPIVVNFWATFCKPCITEIPHFEKVINQYKGDSVELLLVSLDMEEQFKHIRTFAKKFKFQSSIVYLDETDADLFCPRVDEKWSGAIPASLFVNNKTGYRKFLEEEMSEQKFESEIKTLISRDANKKTGL